MKKYLASLVFALITIATFGQSNYQDVLYLKNGSIIRGVIIEKIPTKSIKIETTDGNVFVYQMDEIEGFTKERYKNRSGSYLNKTGLKKGYRVISELGYQFGVGSYGVDRLKVNIINGYQINPYFFAGFGTGLRLFLSADATLLPLFADFRVNFKDDKISPYLSVGAGYTLDIENDFDAVGFLLDPVAGVSIKISDKSAVNIGLGYEMQKLDFYYYSGSGRLYNFSENSGAVSFNVGLSF